MAIESILELVTMCRHYRKPATIYIPNAIDRILTIREKYRIVVFESIEKAAWALTVSHLQHQFF